VFGLQQILILLFQFLYDPHLTKNGLKTHKIPENSPLVLVLLLLPYFPIFLLLVHIRRLVHPQFRHETFIQLLQPLIGDPGLPQLILQPLHLLPPPFALFLDTRGHLVLFLCFLL